MAAARRVARTRARFRRSLLAGEVPLRMAAALLNKVRGGELRLDRTLNVGANEVQRVRDLHARLHDRLPLLLELLAENRRDFRAGGARNPEAEQRRQARRRRCAAIIEELPLRTRRLTCVFEKLSGLSQRCDRLLGQLRRLRSRPEAGRLEAGQQIVHVRRRLCRQIRRAQESPARLRRQVRTIGRRLAEYQQAVHDMALTHQRLVASLARRFRNRGLSYVELLQEGNIGLLRAIEKFNFAPGYRFSTYASYWVRHALMQAVAEQDRMIRVPLRIARQMRCLRRAQERLLQDGCRDPQLGQAAQPAGIEERQAGRLSALMQRPLSLDQPLERGGLLGELVQDTGAVDPRRAVALDRVRDLLSGLEERELRILRLRFGLEGGEAHTLKEVGKMLSMSGERVRQIERRSLEKLRQQIGQEAPVAG